jgi:hypothetical protein
MIYYVPMLYQGITNVNMFYLVDGNCSINMMVRDLTQVIERVPQPQITTQEQTSPIDEANKLT